MVIFNFIGYFTLVLHDFPFPGARDLPHVQISQVLSLRYAIPTSLLLSQGSSDPLPCYSTGDTHTYYVGSVPLEPCLQHFLVMFQLGFHASCTGLASDCDSPGVGEIQV
jgi:hypothetical protein